MDAQDLKVFEAVARAGSMSMAAAELHTVQSNVTARVRKIESRLGLRLFERTPKGVILTAAGQRLLPYAQRLSSLLSDAQRAVLDTGTPQGALTLGSLETTLALRLAPALSEFAGTYPDVDLCLRTGTTRELLDDVIARRVEGAFVCGPLVHAEIEVELICQEELVLLSAPGATALRILANSVQPPRMIVLRLGCSYRQRLEEYLAHRGVPAPRVLEFGTLEAIFSAVSAGLGVTLLPRSLIGPVIKPGRLLVEPLEDGQGLVQTAFIRHREGYRSSALDAFLKSIRRHLGRALPNAT
ncbi:MULTISPECIES: LysR substrate-binding domain-containing protein [Roseomonadaceae]|uniref:LysR family transcriptional regulator n=1 Tax=Falsiroseomonas oleicola TaxID=2801474 RepID=A0ABS6HBK5_9PROT|nr:LysR substrate-binding domain-containing protein [Roseomonas oleicola]MBU8546112.1 LysR family transcriptional regulator [Roseomonas oleicola]